MVFGRPLTTVKEIPDPTDPYNSIFIEIDHNDPNQRRNDVTCTVRSTSGQPSSSYGVNETSRIVKNVIFLSVAIMLIFMAFRNMISVDSYIYSQSDTITLIVTWFLLIFSVIFLPTIVIRALSIKTIILIAIFGYTIHVIVQLHPINFVNNISQIILGVCAFPLWIAVSTYISHVGHEYAKLTSKDPQIPVVKLFGIFFFFYQICGILGPLTSSLLYKPYHDDYDYDYNYTYTDYEDSSSSGVCDGSRFYYLSSNYYTDIFDIELFDHNRVFYHYVESTKFWIVAIFCVTFAIVAILLVVFRVDSLERYGEKRRDTRRKLHLFFATFIQLKNPYQIFLIPFTLFLSLQQFTFNHDFMGYFVGCAWINEPHAGQYTLITYGLAAALSSVSIGVICRRWVPRYGRPLAIALASVFQLCLIIILFDWTPKQGDGQSGILAVAFLWGVTDGIWLVEIHALYGVLFHKHIPEAGFTNYQLWRFVGTMIFVVFFYESAQLHAKVGLFASFFLSLVGYFFIEKKDRNNNQ